VPPAELPPWPETLPAYGSVTLRAFSDRDVPMARELSSDPYVPLIGTLPPSANGIQAHEWIARQHARWHDGDGFSFAIAEETSDRAIGTIGLWLRDLDSGRATAGYSVAPSSRRHGVASAALMALTRFAWTIERLHRVELYIEPPNTGSTRAAERAGYEREGLLRSHQHVGAVRRDMLLYAAIRDEPLSREASR
jgi:RimJ/RimL family protein N-acetyltransferase